MAGIIAQLTRAARIRRDRRTYGTNKCLYTLQPFDTNGFKVRLLHIRSLKFSSVFVGESPQQVLCTEGQVGRPPQEHQGGGGHHSKCLQTIQGRDLSMTS